MMFIVCHQKLRYRDRHHGETELTLLNTYVNVCRASACHSKWPPFRRDRVTNIVSVRVSVRFSLAFINYSFVM